MKFKMKIKKLIPSSPGLMLITIFFTPLFSQSAGTAREQTLQDNVTNTGTLSQTAITPQLTPQPAPPRQTIESDEGPDKDPNENLGPDSRWLGNLKLGLGMGDIEGVSVDYYIWNAPDSMRHFAVSLGLDTQQFKYFFPSAEARFEWGKNHRFALALKFSYLGYQEIKHGLSSDPTYSSGAAINNSPIEIADNPSSDMYALHGFSILAGYTHQGNNRLFFSILGGFSFTIDYPMFPINYTDSNGNPATGYENIFFQLAPAFAIKLGFRFQ